MAAGSGTLAEWDSLQTPFISILSGACRESSHQRGAEVRPRREQSEHIEQDTAYEDWPPTETAFNTPTEEYGEKMEGWGQLTTEGWKEKGERRRGEKEQSKKRVRGREQGKLWGWHNKQAYLINMSWSPAQSSATTESLCRWEPT